MSALEQYAAEAVDPYCIAPDTAATRLGHLPWQRFAVLGDSVAAGIRDPLEGYRDRSFADRLTEALSATRPRLAAVNVAVPYLTIAEIREQQLDDVLAFRPDAVLATAGGNDAFREYDSGRLHAELADLLRPVAEAGATVLTVGLFDLARSGLIPPEHAGGMARRFDELDRITATLTRDLGGIHVDSHHHPLAADPGIFAQDRIHANARGHAVAFAAIVDAIADSDAGRSAHE
ncbi:SGNH/GDSL hydrolase family protein [Micromonospora sp. RTGN7]|uniref:SGNH/GDSL hydrolase family protein n=1 Tax=Micromonospora sp. RTGN7 TaxID=3016526 RepID=UPI0029FEE83B|nr:SGNH/GDSL hydrolase family protein [Micromonospora sp. RTGN7]